MNVKCVLRVLLGLLVAAPAIYLLVTMLDEPLIEQNPNVSPTYQTQPSSTALKACLDRANGLEAQQIIIDEAKKECERLYKP